jgi:parvulin-like peptidyl-prolyl isomerase
MPPPPRRAAARHVSLLPLLFAIATFAAAPLSAEDRAMVRVGSGVVTYADLQDEARFWRLTEASDEQVQTLAMALLDRRVMLHGVDESALKDEDRARAERLADDVMTRYFQRYGGVQGLQAALDSLGWDMARLRAFAERRARENIILRRLVIGRVKAPTEEETLAYERELKESGQPSVLFTVRLIELKVNEPAGPAEKLEARNRAYEALLRIERGEAFEEVAFALSDDKATRSAGGFVGSLSDKSLRPEFFAALSAVETGVATKPVESGGSFYVLQSLGRRDARQLLETARFSQAKNELLAERRKAIDVEFIDAELIALGLDKQYARRVEAGAPSRAGDEVEP